MQHIPKHTLSFIIQKVKTQKLKGVADAYLTTEIMQRINKNPSFLHLLHSSRTDKQLTHNTLFKEFIKDIRHTTFHAYGLFNTKKLEEKWTILQQFKKKHISPDTFLSLHQQILHSHASTRERMPYYDSLYNHLFALTGRPNTILDLGCGLNPVSLPYMHLSHITYYATDIGNDACAFLTQYFTIAQKLLHVTGTSTILNLKTILTTPSLLSVFPAVDVCFMFKLSDVLDTHKHTITEKLIQTVNASWIIASFSTETISKKRMQHPRRKWFELMLHRLHYPFHTLQIPNELFYIIHKHT